jgi:hypothetical protein
MLQLKAYIGNSGSKSGGYALYLSNQEKHTERGDSYRVVIPGRYIGTRY